MTSSAVQDGSVRPVRSIRAFVRRSNWLSRVSFATIVLFVLSAIAAPWLATHSPMITDSQRSLEGPSVDHWFGTDQFGRDLFSRVAFGSRVALTVAGGAVLLSTVIGIPLGLTAARFRRVGEVLLMRCADLLLAFPPIMLALIMLAYFERGQLTLIVTIGLLFAPRMARVTFAAAVPIGQRDYVVIARVNGVRTPRLMFVYVLRNITGALLVEICLEVGFAIVLESGLSFLGIGVPPPAPSWGGLIADGKEFMDRQASGIVLPSLVLTTFVLAFNVLGDQLRDSLDPTRP